MTADPARDPATQDLAPGALLALAAGRLDRLRARGPRVHALTSPVAAPITANLLLSVGAVPSMSADPAEVGAFAASAGALLVNLGMMDPARRAALAPALEAARAAGVPWALDPVFVERAGPRLALARDLAGGGPAVVKLNREEATALALAPGPARVLAVTGAVDEVSDGARRAGIAAGHPLMARVTGAGCAVGALVAAMLAVEPDPFAAAAAALAVAGAAGAEAGARATGPGSFAAGWLDALHALDEAALARHLLPR